MPPKRKSSAVSSSKSLLSGLTFCMTGTMSVSRSEMESFIQANGGEVAKTVTNKCTHLISAETGTKKCADAEKKGAIVVDEAWVREQCGGEGKEDSPPPAPKKSAKNAPKNPKKAAPAPPTSSSSGGAALGGLTFCMTGTMSVSRSEMEAFIQANGGEVAKTVTNKCTHLISAQRGTAKCADAEKKGAIVVDEAWVREQCGDCGGSMEMEEELGDEEEDEVKKAVPAPKAKGKAKSVQSNAEVGSDGSSQHVRLECASSSGGKFWECTLAGSSTTVTYGKVGSSGATQVKEYASAEAAQKQFDKLLKEKKNKGYS